MLVGTRDVASLGSGGLDELRWLKPVRPGDVLRGRLTVLSTRASEKIASYESGCLAAGCCAYDQYSPVAVSNSIMNRIRELAPYVESNVST